MLESKSEGFLFHFSAFLACSTILISFVQKLDNLGLNGLRKLCRGVTFRALPTHTQTPIGRISEICSASNRKAYSSK